MEHSNHITTDRLKKKNFLRIIKPIHIDAYYYLHLIFVASEVFVHHTAIQNEGGFKSLGEVISYRLTHIFLQFRFFYLTRRPFLI
jgi:hypothetical protein